MLAPRRSLGGALFLPPVSLQEVLVEGEVVLRRYRPADLQSMFGLDVICFSKPFRFDLRSMRGFAEHSDAIVLVAERVPQDPSARKFLGFVIVHVERTSDGGRGYVVTLDVLPAERREGISGQLMGEAEALSRAAGARRMELEVHTGNEGAIRFYEQRGYDRAGVRRGFYGRAGGVSLDAYAYRKELSGG